MSEHLWPARAEYLRRGTPVVERGVYSTVLEAPRRERGSWLVRLMVATIPRPAHGDAPLSLVQLDLCSVTARAHAAMAWTVARGIIVLLHPRLGREEDAPYTHVQTLRRMRSLDELVTVAEARAALGWAESVTP